MKGKATEPDCRVRFDSEVFEDVEYYVKSGHILISAKECGKLCIDLKQIGALARELMDIQDVYENVRT